MFQAILSTTSQCLQLSIHPSPLIHYVPVSPVGNILLTSVLGHLLCGQGPQSYSHYQYCRFLCDGI